MPLGSTQPRVLASLASLTFGCEDVVPVRECVGWCDRAIVGAGASLFCSHTLTFVRPFIPRIPNQRYQM